MSSYHRFGSGGKRICRKPPPIPDHDEIRKDCSSYAGRKASPENIDDLIKSANTNQNHYLQQYNKTGDEDCYENHFRMNCMLETYLKIKEEWNAKESTMPEIAEKTDPIEIETPQQTEPPETPAEQMEIRFPDPVPTPSPQTEEQHLSSTEMEISETPASTEKKKKRKKKKSKTCVNSAMQVDPESDGETSSQNPLLAPATPAAPVPAEKEEETKAPAAVDPPTPITTSSDSSSSKKLKTLIRGLDIDTDSQELEKYLKDFGLFPQKISKGGSTQKEEWSGA
ncbi:putative uncharacterized protein DDB_G0290521 [Parasteatoda tepidariorum]|uniref:putative uncharacterized protein DDB_G0290521 n=1 Tax=Parasteatoda tepidariorum TaxID=114398 RepID=UPI001C71DCB5|nr:uncharacterized protein LOC122270666 [Parasteatoda tepidariorum]